MVAAVADGNSHRRIGSIKREVLFAEKSELESTNSAVIHSSAGAHSHHRARSVRLSIRNADLPPFITLPAFRFPSKPLVV
jgi:hypothetical protein